ncbi:MAG: hypothetical protein LIP28_01680, partial [Deltaproteobacteria bacterium]|nr:hypothetical protein [Deltaproteobacteria bacterium]
VCRLRYGPGKKTLTMRRESSITVPVPSGDAAILLRECTEGTFYCTVDYIADEDGDFKRVKAARPARKSD